MVGSSRGHAIKIKMRKSGEISAWNLTVGNVAFHSSWKKVKTHQLIVNPGMDVALMTISVMALVSGSIFLVAEKVVFRSQTRFPSRVLQSMSDSSIL